MGHVQNQEQIKLSKNILIITNPLMIIVFYSTVDV